MDEKQHGSGRLEVEGGSAKEVGGALAVGVDNQAFDRLLTEARETSTPEDRLQAHRDLLAMAEGVQAAGQHLRSRQKLVLIDCVTDETVDPRLEGVRSGLCDEGSEVGKGAELRLVGHEDVSVSKRIHQPAINVNEMKAKSEKADPELRLGRLMKRVSRLPEQGQDSLEDWLDQAPF